MEIHLIWAQDENGGIGKNGKLPWHISSDLKNFKLITINSIVVMGRKTWDSLPIKPLPNRRNIVLSSNKQDNVETYHSIQDCILELEKETINKIFVIGGGTIYKLFYNMADYLHITDIAYKEGDIDEFFPVPYETIKTQFKKIKKTTLSKTAIYSFWGKK